MADIELIESRLVEARQQAATAQRELEERLLESNGAEDEETAQLRTIVETHRSREATLIQVRKAAFAANSAAELAARAETAREAVREAAKLERQFVKAAAAIDAALTALRVARSEFLQIDTVLQATSRKVRDHSNLRDSERFSWSFVNHEIARDKLRRHIAHMFDEVGAQSALADDAATYHAQEIRRLEDIAARPMLTSPSTPPESPYGSATDLTSHTALQGDD
ncbi:hypothetical protein BLA6993_06940 [Burkholderia lata]|uniref:hypothetical protein n=1 Tax=Burkholderia lata (strain ATCC 17760 / DSM 23089 / LMG 22485 / NCIMB 9086 / R18194 / 383) TaxID=482957 RepID=UPI0014537C0E|nr:hypothetical protein [Burkholderia lata]VWC39406.1 hypothetical protein BLA6993_06940 [Burkholderia lata]